MNRGEFDECWSVVIVSIFMRSNKPRCHHVLAGLRENMAVFLLQTKLPVKNTEPSVEDFHRAKLRLLNGKYLSIVR